MDGGIPQPILDRWLVNSALQTMTYEQKIKGLTKNPKNALTQQEPAALQDFDPLFLTNVLSARRHATVMRGRFLSAAGSRP